MKYGLTVDVFASELLGSFKYHRAFTVTPIFERAECLFKAPPHRIIPQKWIACSWAVDKKRRVPWGDTLLVSGSSPECRRRTG